MLCGTAMADHTTNRRVQGMRDFWDARARDNAAWYVDTSLSYDEPDMQRFFATGEAIVSDAFDYAAAVPEGRAVAVEVGSGLGRVCKALSARFDNVIGVDISPEMVTRATELVGGPNISFVVGDGSSLSSIDDGVADLVLTFTVFQHIPDVGVIESYLQEIGRVLKPGGVLIMQWNNTPGARRWALKRWWLGVLQRTRIRPERYLRNAPEFLGSRVPIGGMEQAVAAAGMSLAGTRNERTLYCWGWATKTR